MAMIGTIILSVLVLLILFAKWRGNNALMMICGVILLAMLVLQLLTIEPYIRSLIDKPLPDDIDAKSFLHGATDFMHYIQGLRPFILVEAVLLFLVSVLAVIKKRT